jgi:hypothetical protein
LAVTSALCLIPTAGAQASVAVSTCSSTSTLQVGLLGAAIPSRPSCVTPAIPCPQATVCHYSTLGVIRNGISVSSGVSATTVGIRPGSPNTQSTGSCNGGVDCEAFSSINLNGPGGGVGVCSWFGGPLVAVALGTRIDCVLSLDSVHGIG